MSKTREIGPLTTHRQGVRVFDGQSSHQVDVRATGLPANWRELDQTTKASLVHSSYFRNNDRNTLERRGQFVQAYNTELEKKGYSKSEKPLFTTSNEIITFSIRGEEDINFRRPKTETVQRLKWSTMEQDLPAWDRSVKWLAQTSDLDDDTFRVEIVPKISLQLLEESPIFQHLASGDIDVTANHRALKKTPFLHTFDVLMAVETEASEDNRERFFLRFHALFHDIGKAIIANNDHFQDHGAFSQSMLIEYATKMWKMSTLEAYQMTQMERWHHASENINKGYLTNKDVLSEMYNVYDIMPSSSPLFTPDFLYTALMELNIADTASVQRHDFTLEAAQVSLEGFQLLALKLKDFPESLQQWLLAISHAGIYYVSQLAISEAEKIKKLQEVEVTVFDAVNHIRNLKPEIKEKLFDLFNGSPKSAVTPKRKIQVRNRKDIKVAA